MPLKCLHDNTTIFAFDFDTAGWKQLKASSADARLIMTCCQARAVPKVSKLGTRFFAHHQSGDCTSTPETAEHLWAKTIVCQTARAVGWTADTEVRGQTPAGEDWVADVLATKGSAKVAIEIQWSRQGTDETKRRQRRYADSGVRALWLLRHPDLLLERDTPSFLLDVRTTSESAAFVRLPSSQFDSRWVTNRNKSEAEYWQQTIALETFVRGALTGSLQFAPAIDQPIPVTISATKIRCWRCKRETRTVQGLTLEVSKRFAGHPDLHTSLEELYSGEEAAPWLANLFPAELLKQYGIGVIKPRFSRTAGCSYLSNGCIHCDALQGRHFDHDDYLEATDVCQYEVTLSSELLEQLAAVGNDSAYRWWFAER